MKKSAFLTILILMMFAPAWLRAKDFQFHNFGTDEGLPDNSVRASFQDSDGLMWFCTRDGICMYDGFHFKSLEDPSCDILDGLAICVSEDKDRHLWFVTTKGIGYHDLDTGETKTVHRSSGGLLGSADIAVDRTGRVWIASEDIFCWDPTTQSLTDYSAVARFKSDALASDSNGGLWFLAGNGSLYRFDSRTSSFEQIWTSTNPSRSSRHAIVSDGNGKILFSAFGGSVMQVDIMTYNVSALYRTDANEIRSIILREDGSCWLGTDKGIIVREGDSSTRILNDISDPFSLAGEDVWSMYQDNQGNIWVGFFYNGLSLCRNTSGMITRYYGKVSGGILSGEMIRPIVQTDERHLLVGAEDGGLTLLDLTTNTAEDLTFYAEDGTGLNYQGLCISGGDVWIATFGNGVFRMNLQTRKITGHYLSDLSSTFLYKTKGGTIYAGTTSGLYKYDARQDRFSSCPEFGSAFIHTICEDSRGTLWVGTYGKGLWLWNAGELKYISSADKSYGLTSDYITSIREDSRHRIWVCTEAGGACVVSLDAIPSDGNFVFRNLSKKDGVSSSIISCVQEDLDHVLWLTTSHGIVKLDPDDLSIREIYLENRGNTRNQYSYGSAYATSSGRLFFGTSRGLISFSPSGGRDVRARLFITEITGTNSSGDFTITEEGKSTIRTEKIRVKYADLSGLTVHFASPDFRSSRSSLFESVLQGGRKTIRQLSTEGSTSFTDLAPGHYDLRIRRMGGASQEMANLSIDIIPPFFRSRLAYALDILILLVALYFIVKHIEQLRKMRMARQVELLETEKQKEIYDAKINFFTNITHEIRTPLTLIKMPLDKLVAGGSYKEENKQDLLTMQANADRLLDLTNQLLDLRKMEKLQIRPTFTTTDLPALVRKTCDRFVSIAEDQNIKLETSLPDTPFNIECASEMVEKIIGNLLSNAFKYGKGYIKVALERPDEDKVRVRVDSNGDRIPEKDVEKIFEKFYQSGPAKQGKGAGLGLPYARNLAVLNNGTLTLDRSVTDMNSFVLELPVHQEGFVKMSSSRNAEEAEEAAQTFDSMLHTVLVVEDDPEMRGYLTKELSQYYNVLTAANGENALDVIGQNRVDLVISDIMMPGIDGCTLCNRIKFSVEFCHIPVILLTAAVGMETHIQTLKAGADGYIEKPFAIDLLLATISNLFKNREIANRQFTNSPLSHFNSVVTGGMDQEFMEKLHDCVMKHLSESDLNIETLTDELGTSKSTLYRKVTANTGLNINEYIRVSRLKKAAEMLSSQKYRISEVAYMTGFSSPSYFATCFQKQFNVPPSSFMKGLKG